jgi:hypothetical protein
MKINDDNLAPRLAGFKNHINAKIAELTESVASIRKRMGAVVRDLNRHAEMTLRVEEREESGEMFINLRDSAPAQKEVHGGSSP